MPNDRGPDERRLSHHILPSAATMLGVCVTLVGLVKVVEVRAGPSHVDEYAGLASILFLLSATASYVAIRHASEGPWSRRFERLADQCFMVGLLAVSAIAVFFAYEII